MLKEKSNAINFSYLLLDYYKKLNITENELAVILMIDHLLSQDEKFVTADMLSLKMSMTLQEIDVVMANLLTKGYLRFDIEKNEASVSIEPLKKVLFHKFQEAVFTEEEIKSNEEIELLREKIYDQLESFFSRSLTAFEISHIDNWIEEKIDEDIILNSIKDAINSNITSISYIDKRIIYRLKQEDNVGTKIK